MEKHEVIKYLEYFLRVNGQRRNMGTPVKKWKEDLKFVQEYNMETQPQVYLSDVKRYTRTS